MIEISVVIPTFNRCDQLRICLLALAAQEHVAMQSKASFRWLSDRKDMGENMVAKVYVGNLNGRALNLM